MEKVILFITAKQPINPVIDGAMRKSGLTYICAENSKTAISLIKEKHIRLIVMGDVLSNENTIQVLLDLKNAGVKPIIILCVSSIKIEDVRIYINEYGVSRIYKLPIDIENDLISGISDAFADIDIDEIDKAEQQRDEYEAGVLKHKVFKVKKRMESFKAKQKESIELLYKMFEFNNTKLYTNFGKDENDMLLAFQKRIIMMFNQTMSWKDSTMEGITKRLITEFHHKEDNKIFKAEHGVSDDISDSKKLYIAFIIRCIVFRYSLISKGYYISVLIRYDTINQVNVGITLNLDEKNLKEEKTDKLAKEFTRTLNFMIRGLGEKCSRSVNGGCIEYNISVNNLYD